jgi:hypothetical protein
MFFVHAGIGYQADSVVVAFRISQPTVRMAVSRDERLVEDDN